MATVKDDRRGQVHPLSEYSRTRRCTHSFRSPRQSSHCLWTQLAVPGALSPSVAMAEVPRVLPYSPEALSLFEIRQLAFALSLYVAGDDID